MASHSDIFTIRSLAEEILRRMNPADRDVLEDEITFGSDTLHEDLAALLEDHRVTPTTNRIRLLYKHLRKLLNTDMDNRNRD